jgi:ribonuclease HI
LLSEIWDPFNEGSPAVFYTDGSKGSSVDGNLQTAAGLCQVGPDGEILQTGAWNTGPRAEVADAETFGIYQALKAAQQIQPTPTTLYIFVDSQAAIQRLQQYSNPTAQKAKRAVETFGRQTQIQIIWCPSHKGIPGNETADRMAKQGLSQPTDPEAYTSTGYLQGLVRKQIVSDWETLWQTEESRRGRGLGTLYRRITRGEPRLSAKHNLLKTRKATQSAYIQLKTGVGFLRAHLARIGKVPNDTCSCGSIQDTAHLILRCKRYRQQRGKLRRALQGLPLSLHVLFCTQKGRLALANYLEATEMCTVKWAIGA